MAARMVVCRSCGRYALRDACTVCSGATSSPHPARFSPEDRFGKYRRQLKRLVGAQAERSKTKGGA